MASEVTNEDIRWEKLTEILEDVKSLLMLQTALKQNEIREWITSIFGKSLRLKQVYCSIDGVSSAGDIAKKLGMTQKKVSTALTHLFKTGLLEIVKPYKRGYIYKRKVIHDSLRIVDYIETLIVKQSHLGKLDSKEEEEAN